MKMLVTSLPDLKKINPQRPHHLLKYLSQKHEVTVLSVNAWWLKERQDNYLKDAIEHMKLFYLSERKINPVFQELSVARNSNTFCNKFNRNAFDVHLNFNSLIAGYFIAKRMRIPTIFDICDDLPERIRISPQIPFLLKPSGKLVGQFMMKKNIELAKRITYVTKSLSDSYNFPKDKSVLIPNGVDTVLFHGCPSQELKEELGLGEDFVVGFVGVLSEWVELEPTFIALKELVKKHFKIKMLVVGGGEKIQDFRNLAERYGISDSVIFTGNISYTLVPKYVSCMDCCLISLNATADCHNAFPLTLLEYMACEKPVISTPLAGVMEAVGNQVLYASNGEELKQNILKLYYDEDLGIEMGKRGRELVERNYSWDKICYEFEKGLIEACEKGGDMR
jgi:glycosyltransferase involved in cell wall biosynthesis